MNCTWPFCWTVIFIFRKRLELVRMLYSYLLKVPLLSENLYLSWLSFRSFSVFADELIQWTVCVSLREKCPNTEFFLVHIFSHTKYLSVFSPNAGKYGPEKTPYLDTFHAVYVWNKKRTRKTKIGQVFCIPHAGGTYSLDACETRES